ncbi:MAG: TolC family protein [Bacteroidales bacterium]
MRLLIISCCLFATLLVSAQQKWTLKQCIEHAMVNNIQVRQKMLEKQSAEIQLNTTKMSRLPDLNAEGKQDFGRSTSRDGTKSFQNSANTSFGIGSSVPLFTGFKITNEIESKKWSLKAAIADLDKAREDIALYVASAYLQVVYNRELNKIALDQANLSREQIKKAEILVGAGKLAQSELYETRSTNARDESDVTRTNSELKLSLVDLAQLLEVEAVDKFEIDTSISDSLLVEGMVNLADIDQTYEYAAKNRPAMKSAEYKLEESLRNEKIAKSGYFPSLELIASYGNAYIHTYGIVNSSFSNQISENGQGVIGLHLQIPIFNRFATRNQVRLAQLDIESRKLNLETTRKSVLKDVQQAYYKAVAAKDKLTSAQKAVEAADLALGFTKEKYQAGKATSFEFNESNNRRLKALSDQVQAKYDFIFRCKILDFYNGRAIF